MYKDTNGLFIVV